MPFLLFDKRFVGAQTFMTETYELNVLNVSSREETETSIMKLLSVILKESSE